MTNASKKTSFAVLLGLMLAVSIFSGALVSVAHASEDDWSYPIDNGDWSYPIDNGDWSYPIDNGDWSYPIDNGDWSYPLDNGYGDDWSYPIDYGYGDDWSYPIDYGNDCYSECYSQGGVQYSQQSYGSQGCGSSCGGNNFGSPCCNQSQPPRPISPPGYPIPPHYPQPPRPTPIPPQPPRPTPYPTPTPYPVPQPTPINIVNTNTNTNTNVNVAPVYPVTPQIPVQYTFPQQGLYCVISASGNTLTWTSSGASSAMLSDGIGYVAPNGTLVVRPELGRSYVLTVYGAQGQVATCNAYVAAVAPYVSLSQIPYTGFDLGPIGNAMYFAVLLALAGALAYVALYFKGGVLAIAGDMVRREEVIVKNDAPIVEVPVQEVPQSFVDETPRTEGTIDTMALEGNRIVISRR